VHRTVQQTTIKFAVTNGLSHVAHDFAITTSSENGRKLNISCEFKQRTADGADCHQTTVSLIHILTNAEATRAASKLLCIVLYNKPLNTNRL